MQLNKFFIICSTGLFITLLAACVSTLVSETDIPPASLETTSTIETASTETASTIPPTQTILTETSPPETSVPTVELPPFITYDLPQAQSISVVSGTSDSLYLIYGIDKDLFIAHSTDGGVIFGDGVPVNANVPAHVLSIERPAMAVNENGLIGVAWLELPSDFNGGKIWYSQSQDGGQTFSPGQHVGTESVGETTMVDISLFENGNPIIFWLNGSHLKFSRSIDQGLSFSEIADIGDGSCECCQPHSAINGSQVFIAYRGLEVDPEKGDIRDALIIRSENEGQTFLPVSRVSDTHWYLPACPIAGPSLFVDQEKLYVAWMDGRQSPEGTFGRGDIWLAWSLDGGESFSANIRINPDQTMHHTMPFVDIGPGGRIHVAWEAKGSNKNVLYYSYSDDNGQTFTDPFVIVSSTDNSRGQPKMPVLTVSSSGRIALTWIDRLGAHLITWVDTN